MDFKNMTLMEYITSEPRRFFLTDLGTNGLKFVNKKVYEVYENPEVQFEMAKILDQEFPGDFVYPLSDGNIISETLGVKLLKPDYDFPSPLEHKILTVEDVRALKVPDPQKDGRMPTNLKSQNLIATGIDKPLYVSIFGPFTLAVQLAGATHLLRELIKNKDFVVELLDFTCQCVRIYAKAVVDAGVKYMSIAEPASVTLSPENFRELVLPRLKSVYESVDCWKQLHICGDTRKFLPLMIESGPDAISLDQIMDLKSAVKIFPDDMVLVGNIDPIDIIGRGNVADVERVTYKLLEDLEAYPNYMVAFGCNAPNDAPDENIKRAIEITKSYMTKF